MCLRENVLKNCFDVMMIKIYYVMFECYYNGVNFKERYLFGFLRVIWLVLSVKMRLEKYFISGKDFLVLIDYILFYVCVIVEENVSGGKVVIVFINGVCVVVLSVFLYVKNYLFENLL